MTFQPRGCLKVMSAVTVRRLKKQQSLFYPAPSTETSTWNHKTPVPKEDRLSPYLPAQLKCVLLTHSFHDDNTTLKRIILS